MSGWKENFKNTPNEMGVFFGKQDGETEHTIKFAVKGEVIVSIGSSQFLAKGLAPVMNSQELYELMLEYFKMKEPIEEELKK